ncbi:MAG: RAMP superfamily CRISPR-associated protein [Candidatus Diapherotrites archaeon]
MKHYRLTARLESPLAIQKARQSHASAGLDYLPGSSLRGALAAQLLRRGGRPEDAVFRALFIEDQVCFPNLLPTDDPRVTSQVLPLTVLTCKRRQGFRTQKGDGVEDSLALSAGNRLLANWNNPKAWDCKVCGQERIPFYGFWNGNVDAPWKYEVSMTFQRHTGIDRVTGTVALEIFYTTQAVANFRKNITTGEFHPQHLSGGMWLRDEHAGFLRTLCQGDSLFVGADRTRGLGEITLELEEASAPELDQNAWGEWDQGFKDKFHRVTSQNLPEGRYFSITLASPAILVDEFLRPTARLPLTFPGLDPEPLVQVAKSHLVRGWQSSWGLPKPDDLALSAGSVFLWRYHGDDFHAMTAELQRITQEGIGLRREEGFGRLTVCELLNVREVI